MQFTLLLPLLLLAIIRVSSYTGTVSEEASGKTVSIACGTNQKIVITSAAYGNNCGQPSDEKSNLGRVCDDIQTCSYVIDHSVIGDPAFGCKKDYDYVYVCVAGALVNEVSAEASGKSFTMSCGEGQAVQVIQAYYGKNCNGINVGQSWSVNYQQQNLASACDGYQTCTYNIDHDLIGDSAYGCRKEYNYEYTCV